MDNMEINQVKTFLKSFNKQKAIMRYDVVQQNKVNFTIERNNNELLKLIRFKNNIVKQKSE